MVENFNPKTQDTKFQLQLSNTVITALHYNENPNSPTLGNVIFLARTLGVIVSSLLQNRSRYILPRMRY